MIRYQIDWLRIVNFLQIKNFSASPIFIAHTLRGGVYKKSAAGNVSPCWVNEENDQAIWWISHLNEWAIGDLSSLGTDIRGITGRKKENNDGIEFGMPICSNYTDCNEKMSQILFTVHEN